MYFYILLDINGIGIINLVFYEMAQIKTKFGLNINKYKWKSLKYNLVMSISYSQSSITKKIKRVTL